MENLESLWFFGESTHQTRISILDGKKKGDTSRDALPVQTKASLEYSSPKVDPNIFKISNFNNWEIKSSLEFFPHLSWHSLWVYLIQFKLGDPSF